LTPEDECRKLLQKLCNVRIQQHARGLDPPWMSYPTLNLEQDTARMYRYTVLYNHTDGYEKPRPRSRF